MNRKDTIIVAVLINAGLLVMLFVSALKSEAPGSVAKQDKAVSVEKQVAAIKKDPPIAKSNPDQVDQILAQYSKKIVKESLKEVPKEEKKVEPVLAKPQETVAPKEEIAKVIPSKPAVEKEPAKKAPHKEKESPKQEEPIKVVVKKGDVLEKIAKIYGTTVGALMQENQLTDSRLQIGQVLQIPKEREIAHPKAMSAIQMEEKFYIVKNGDNLWKIAIENHMKVEELLHLNQLSEKQAKALRPGDRLRIQ